MRKALMSAAVLVLAVPAAGAQDTVKITSLEWPPYAGTALPNLGTFWDSVTAAFAAGGTTAEVEFYPWQRAVALGLETDGYVGYGPEYFSEDLNCVWSDPIGQSPVGFVQNVDAPITWQSVDDLTAYTIGVVAGYVNDGAEFDAQMEAGALDIDAVNDDLTNVRKVAAGRLDAAVIDTNVLGFLTEVSEPGLADKVEMNETLLISHGLHICFADTDAGRAARDRLNAGLPPSS